MLARPTGLGSSLLACHSARWRPRAQGSRIVKVLLNHDATTYPSLAGPSSPGIRPFGVSLSMASGKAPLKPLKS